MVNNLDLVLLKNKLNNKKKKQDLVKFKLIKDKEMIL